MQFNKSVFSHSIFILIQEFLDSLLSIFLVSYSYKNYNDIIQMTKIIKLCNMPTKLDKSLDKKKQYFQSAAQHVQTTRLVGCGLCASCKYKQKINPYKKIIYLTQTHRAHMYTERYKNRGVYNPRAIRAQLARHKAAY